MPMPAVAFQATAVNPTRNRREPSHTHTHTHTDRRDSLHAAHRDRDSWRPRNDDVPLHFQTPLRGVGDQLLRVCCQHIWRRLSLNAVVGGAATRSPNGWCSWGLRRLALLVAGRGVRVSHRALACKPPSCLGSVQHRSISQRSQSPPISRAHSCCLSDTSTSSTTPTGGWSSVMSSRLHTTTTTTLEFSFSRHYELLYPAPLGRKEPPNFSASDSVSRFRTGKWQYVKKWVFPLK
jgi:hypothetical protein